MTLRYCTLRKKGCISNCSDSNHVRVPYFKLRADRLLFFFVDFGPGAKNQTQVNRPSLSSENPHFQSEAK